MASKRRQRRKSCGRKRRYETYDEAFQAVIATARYNRTEGQGLRELTEGANNLWAYPCSICGGFHIGHDPGIHTTPELRRKGRRP